VFVFGIPGLPELPPLPPEHAVAPVFDVAPASQAPLTLVLTLTLGPASAAGAAEADVEAGNGERPAKPADLAGGGPGDEAAAAFGAGEEAPRPGAGGIDTGDKLRGLDLYEPIPDPVGKEQSSGRPVLPELRAVFTALGKQPTCAGCGVAFAAEARPPGGEVGAADTPAAVRESRAPLDGYEWVNRPGSAGSGRADDAVFASPPPAWDRAGDLVLALILTGALAGRRQERQRSCPQRTARRPGPDEPSA
jgi:hypothetical protein